MLLAGDVGGTKTRLGLFEAIGRRPPQLVTREYATLDFPSLVAMLEDFRKAAGSGSAIDAACFGVAGPVIGNVGQLTNVPWRVEADRIAGMFSIRRVSILNDLEATAHAVPLLDSTELHTLQEGMFRRDGNIAVIAAGTGLGEALLHRVAGRYIPSPGEGGHADFAPRNEREIAVLRDVTMRFGRASVEHVLSGPGLQNLHRVTHRIGDPERVALQNTHRSGDPERVALQNTHRTSDAERVARQKACPAAEDEDDTLSAAAISRAALEKKCPECVEALEMFVDIYGAEAGNLALRSLATGGVFVGGGIAPKILPALTDGRFMRAFLAKPPHVPLLSSMPVHVIVNTDAALIGAAVCAGTLAD